MLGSSVSKMPQMGFKLVLHCFLLCSAVLARELPPIFWNSTNPIFRLNSRGSSLSVQIRDRMDIACPFYDTSTQFNPATVEYSKIYQVPRWSFEDCVLPSPDERKVVGVCSAPYEEERVTIMFREFTPKPGGLEFVPGETYYFISTSTGSLDGLSNQKGGLCWSGNMKFKVEIEPDVRYHTSERTPTLRHRHRHHKGSLPVTAEQFGVANDQGDEGTYYEIAEEYWPAGLGATNSGSHYDFNMVRSSFFILAFSLLV